MQVTSILSSPAADPHLYESDVATAVAVAEAGAGDRERVAGSLVVAALIATLGAGPRERDWAIGAVLASGMGISILLPGYYQGFAAEATNILFGNIFGVSGSQLLILVVIGPVVVAVIGTWYRPLLFASIDPETAEARGVPVRGLGLMFLLVRALTVHRFRRRRGQQRGCLSASRSAP